MEYLVYVETEHGPTAYFPLVTANSRESAELWLRRAGLNPLSILEVKQ